MKKKKKKADGGAEDDDLFSDLPLFAKPPPVGPRFNGSDYVPERDDERLRGQIRDVWEAVRSGEWYSLRELERITSHPQASISAQLRHLRKPRFGGMTIEKRYCGNGLFEYRLAK